MATKLDISLTEASDLLASAQTVAVLAHENPDGDAIGSSVGLVKYLQNLGKEAVLLLSGNVPTIYQDFAPIEYRCEISAEEVANFELVVQLDTANLKRISAPQGVVISDDLPLLVVDHHVDNQRYGRWNMVQKSAATAELVYSLIMSPKLYCEEAIDQVVATALLLGVVTDTGAFRFDNTTPEALECGANLMRLGGDYRKIITDIFFTKTLNRQKFEAELLNNHLEMYLENRLAVVKIPTEIIEKYQIIMSECEGLIDAFRCIAGVDNVVTLYVRAGNQLKISGRSKNPKYPIGNVMRQIGGGGHDMAAGCLIQDGDINAMAEKIIELVEKEYQ